MQSENIKTPPPPPPVPPQPPRQQPPRKSKKSPLVWILPVVGAVIIAMGVGGWFIYKNHADSVEARRQFVEDSIARVTKMRRDSLEFARMEEQRLDSIRRNMTSPDLDFFELHGKVKTLVTNFMPGFGTLDELIVIEFSPEGEWTNRSSLKEPYKDGRIMRDADGYIVKWEYNSDNDLCFTKNFRWSDSKIVKESGTGWEYGYDVSYSYNNAGHRDHATGTSGGEGTVSDDKATYSYQEYDDFGNWTERTVKSHWAAYEDYEDRRYIDSGSDTSRQHRTITYYD